MNRWLEEHRTLVLSAVGLLIAVSAAALLIRQRPAAAIVIEPPLPTAAPPPSPTPGPVQVYVSGAVVNPDVYTLPPDAIVRDALLMAGGPAAEADLDRINLAQSLHNGDHVHVPRVGEAPLPLSQEQPSENQPPALTGPININTATRAELELLDGIGPVLAERIIAYRESYGPFQTIDDILNVPGIGPAKLDAIRDWITLE